MLFWLFFLYLLCFFFFLNSINRYLLKLLQIILSNFIIRTTSEKKKNFLRINTRINSWNFFFFFFFLLTYLHPQSIEPISRNEIPISPVQFSSMPHPSHQNFLGGKMLFPRVAPRHYGNRSNVRHKGNRIPPCTGASRLH